MTDQFEKDASELIRSGLFSSGDLTQDAEPIPTSMGPFQILRLLGRGGLADVYLAKDSTLGREVALKILHRVAPMKMERFVREARVAALLSHPHIVQVFDAGAVEGFHYISMQFIDGMAIGEMKLTPREAAEKIATIAFATHYAHQQGIVHRDITPRNILVDRAGKPFLADFGLAKYLDHDTKQLSVTGSVLGTPTFMSPEQARGEVHKLDARTDVYGLGATLYSLATGMPPFPEGTLLSVIRQVTDNDPVPPRHHLPELSRELELIIQMAMEKEPGRRYATAEELGKDLQRFLDRLPIVAHPPSFMYRIRKRVERHKGAYVTGLLGAFAVAAVAAIFVPRWLEERASALSRESQLQIQRDAQLRSEEALRELATLWGDLLLAKQGWYQSQKNPAETREAIAAAVQTIGAFLERNPGLPQGYYIRARGRMYLEEFDAARSDLDAALKVDPEFTPAWALLGRVLIEKYRMSIYGRDPTKAEKIRKLRPLLEEARAAFDKGWRHGAEEASIRKWGLRKMREDEVSEIVGQALVAWYLRDQRDEGRRILREAHERSPSEEYANLLGMWEDDPKRAIAHQDEALRIMPHYAKARHDRGSQYWQAGRFAEAEQDYTEAIRINPRFMPAYINRSLMRAKRGDMPGVIEDATRALELDPTIVEALLNRSYAYQAMNDFDAALRDATDALQIDPEFAEAHVNVAMAKIRLGDFKGAAAEATRAIELSPTLTEAWLDRGAARSQMGDFPGALADFSKALEIAPRHPEGHFNRGVLRQTMSEEGGANRRELLLNAESDYLKALDFAPAEWPHRPLVETLLKQVRDQLARLGEGS